MIMVTFVSGLETPDSAGLTDSVMFCDRYVKQNPKKDKRIEKLNNNLQPHGTNLPYHANYLNFYGDK